MVKDASSENKWCLIVDDVLLSSGTYAYAEQLLLIQDDEHFDRDKDVNLPHVEFATSAYTTHWCKKQFYMWTVLDFSEPSWECFLIG
jgi:hypothetical protein